MYYVIISRSCVGMQQELPNALQGRENIRVVLDRRYGERRVDDLSRSPDRRRKKRRHHRDLPVVDPKA